MVVCNDTLSQMHWEVDDVAGTLTLHQLGSIICGICALVSCIVSFFLMYKHADNYTNPKEQRQILRILLMIPVYSVTTMFSYVWYWHAVYWKVARDCYEAFAIAAFFALLCQFVAPQLGSQKEYFATMPVRPWPWPANWFNKCVRGKLRAPRSGLTWFNIIWFCVFQYCFIRVGMTIIATVTQVTGDYCGVSLHPAFAHFWTLFFNIISVSIAMYFLLAFYIGISHEIKPHKPFLKFLCIKLVIFLSFWQMIIFDFLFSANIVKPTSKISPGDIAIGFNAMLVCFEMMIFSIMHLWAFPWKSYAPTGEEFAVLDKSRKSRGQALLDTFNPLDLIKAFGRGMKWVLIGRRRRHSEAEKVAARRKDSVNYQAAPGDDEEARVGLVANAGTVPTATLPVPGSFPHQASYISEDTLPLHPTPDQQTPVPQPETEPQFGFAEREHTGYRPSPVQELQPPHRPPMAATESPPSNPYSPVYPPAPVTSTPPSAPTYYHTVPSPLQSPPRTSPLYPVDLPSPTVSPLPYPDVSTMPSLRRLSHPQQPTMSPPLPPYPTSSLPPLSSSPPLAAVGGIGRSNNNYQTIPLNDSDHDHGYNDYSPSPPQPPQAPLTPPPAIPAALQPGGGQLPGSPSGGVGGGGGGLNRPRSQSSAGAGWGYSESMMDEEGVYQGPVQRRGRYDDDDDDDGNGGVGIGGEGETEEVEGRRARMKRISGSFWGRR